MADAIILANGSVVKKDLFDDISFHKNGFVNHFVINGKTYISLYFNRDLKRFAIFCEANHFYQVKRLYDNQKIKRPEDVFKDSKLDPSAFKDHLALEGVDRVFVQTRFRKAGATAKLCKRIKSWILQENEIFDISKKIEPPSSNNNTLQESESCDYLKARSTAIYNLAEGRKNDNDITGDKVWDDDVIEDIAEILDSLDDNIVADLTASGIINTTEILAAQAAIWTADPDSTTNYYYYTNKDLKAYRDYLKRFKAEFLANREAIGEEKEKTKMLNIAAAFSSIALEHLSVAEKIKILDVIAQGYITGFYFSTGYNEEFMVLRIINAVTFGQATDFLIALTKEYEHSSDGFKSLYQVLYSKIQDESFTGLGDDNRRKLIGRLYELWYSSPVFNPISAFSSESAIETEAMYSEYAVNNSPIVLNYDAKRSLGFYVNNMEFTFSKGKIKVKEKKEVEDNSGTASGTKSINADVGEYGYFQAMSFQDYNNGELAISIPVVSKVIGEDNTKNTLLPIFFLKYLDDSGESENIWQGFKLTLEVALTFSGIGNLTKLRHLSHLTKLPRLLLTGQTIPTATRILALQAVIGGTAVVELTAGVAALILNYYTAGCSTYINGDINTGSIGVTEVINDSNESAAIPEQPNNPDYLWCKNLDRWLFWVQIASAGVHILSELMVRQASKKLIQDGGIPNDFPPDALDVITKYADDADAFLAKYSLARKAELFTTVNPAVLRRIGDGSKGFAKTHFNQNFMPDNVKAVISECVDLGLTNPKFIEDTIAMACRTTRSKRFTFDEVLIHINFYKKVTLKNGFPSGFLNIGDFNLYCNKAKDYFESTPEFANKVLSYRVQGSSLYKKSDFNPPDPDNIPFIKKRNPNPPPEYLNEPNLPDDLDVQLLMTRNNAIELVGDMKQLLSDELKLFAKGSEEYNNILDKMSMLEKGLNKGIINYFIMPENFYNSYRTAIKHNGVDLFKQPSSEGSIEVGFSVVVQGSLYDVLPIMKFK